MSERSTSHVAFCPLPVTGHLYATLGVAAELVRRGHRVSYASLERYRGVVEAVGAELVPYRIVPRLPGRDRSGPDLLRQLLRFSLADATAVVPQLTAAYEADLPDLVLCDEIEYGGQVFAARHRLPVGHLRTAFASNEAWSLTHDASRLAADDPIHAAVDAGLAQLLATFEVPVDVAELRPGPGEPHLVFLPRAFQYRGETFDERFHFVGPCPRPRVDEAGWTPPGDGRPVVLVTLGTIDNNRPEFYRACLAAFADEDWHVIVGVGERIDPASIGTPAPNTSVHRFVPQLEILDHAALMVSHGGMGGLMEAFAAGVPVVTVPCTAEQEANAARVAELGLGIRLPEAARAGEPLREAVAGVLADRGVAARVAAMRAEIRAAGGATRAADVVEARLRVSA